MSRETMDLTGLWRFQPDLYGEGRRAEYFRPDVDTRLWPEVAVPCAFEDCLPELSFYEGRGWFVRRVDVPGHWRGRHAVLRFEAVHHRAAVWVNGKLAGEHADGHVPFDLPVGELLNFGDENTITVEADNRPLDGDVPGQVRGWWTYGGILREVSLIVSDPLRIEAVKTIAGADGSLEQSIQVTNGRAEAADVQVELTLTDADGLSASYTTDPATLPAGKSHGFEISESIPDVRPWSPELPALYTADVSAIVDGLEVDSRRLRVGFRTIRTEGTRLLLNGQDMFLKGFNRHEDSPSEGMCTDLATARRDLQAMKDMGCNFVRLCHYPHHPGELDLCDEIGLLAKCEIPLWGWGGSRQDNAEAYDGRLAAGGRQLTSMIRRDWNHPSVVIWSVSNETNESMDDVVTLNEALMAHARGLDDSRLVVHVSNHWAACPHFETDDVVCINGYPTWGQYYNVANEPVDIDASLRTWRDGLAKLHGEHPDKPILVTEFGGFSLAGVRGGAGGENLHAAAIQSEFPVLRDTPYVCGATVWCWADHPWPPNTWMNDLHVSPFGVMTRERVPKAAYWAAREIFAPPPEERTLEPAAAPHEPSAGHGIWMVRPHLHDIPQAELPEGFAIRGLRSDEPGVWTDIECDAEPYGRIGPGVFYQSFGRDPRAWARRVLLLEDQRGVAIGTVAAWRAPDFLGEEYGQIHWLALRPAWQGKGLARPLLSHAMNLLAQWHDCAMLQTSTARLPAIKLYLDYGFVPLIRSKNDESVWRQFRESLDHPGLDAAIGT